MIDPDEIRSPIVIYIVLASEALLDEVSWAVALKAFRSAKGDLGYCQAMKSSKDPPSFSVLRGYVGAPWGSSSRRHRYPSCARPNCRSPDELRTPGCCVGDYGSALGAEYFKRR